MKRKWTITLVLATALIGFAGISGAQASPHGPHGAMGGPPAGMMGGGGDFQHLLGMLKNANDLNVSDEQIEQIETILENARPQFESLGEQLRTQMMDWRDATDPAVFDETATRQFADGQAGLHADLMVHQMRTRSEVLSVLTPEQRETLEQIRGERQGRRGEKGHSKPCR